MLPVILRRFTLLLAAVSLLATLFPRLCEAAPLLLGAPEDPVHVHAAIARAILIDGEQVLILPEAVCIRQGRLEMRAASGVLWLIPGSGGAAVLDCYLEGRVAVAGTDKAAPSPGYALVRLATDRGVIFHVEEMDQLTGTAAKDVLYRRAHVVRRGKAVSEPDAGDQDEDLFAAGDIRVSAEASRRTREDNLDRVILRGNVTVASAELTVSADTAILWVEHPPEGSPGRPRIRDIYAEGTVTFLTTDGLVRAERLYFDVATNEGLALDARAQIVDQRRGIAFVFAAPELHQLDPDRLLAPDACLSTCTFTPPHYCVRTSRLRLVRGSADANGDSAERTALAAGQQIVTTLHNVIWLGPVPIFYLPYASHDVSKDTFFLADVRVGNSGEFGAFLFTAWNLYDLGIYRNGWSDLELMVDEYEERGTGIGLGFDYEGPSRFGFLNAYYLEDRKDFELDGVPVPKDDRGRVLWRHREFLADGWRADAEFSWLSDRNFLRMYFEDEFEEGKEQESTLYLRKLDDNQRFYVLARDRVNSFATVVERLPEAGLDIIANPLLGGPVLWSSRSTMGYLRLNSDDDLAATDPDGTGRFDTWHEAALPLALGPIQVDPFLEAAATVYSETPGDESTDGRVVGGYGVRIGASFFRTFDGDCELLQIRRVRHIIMPTIDYRRIHLVSEDPGEFPQFDAADARDYAHSVGLGLRNRFQTKRGRAGRERTVDFLVVDVEYTSFPGGRGLNAGLDDFLEIDFIWRITDQWVFSSRGNEYNTVRGRWDEANGCIEWLPLDSISVAYEHAYLWRPQADGPDYSIGTFNLGYEPRNSRWRLEVAQNYDFNGERTVPGDDNAKNLGTTLAVRRRFHDWTLVVTAEIFKGPDEETSIGLRLVPGTGKRRTTEL